MCLFLVPDKSYIRMASLLCCQSTDKSGGRVALGHNAAESYLAGTPSGMFLEVIDDVPLPRLTATEVGVADDGTDYVVAERAGQVVYCN